MCGIAGALLQQEALSKEEWSVRLERMITILHHRGPDDWGIWSSDMVGLAHSRLSILDLSPAGHQPMISEDGAVAVLFNGEIYNFRELRRELEEKGCRFTSCSDTEVLVHGYRIWGTSLVHRLKGMFAFAVWDEGEKRLLLARDRFGKKPLYYYYDGKRLIFGSEIKAILPFGGIPREPNHEAIHHYLTFQYVPGPWSAFRGIRKLKPGCLLTLGAEWGEPRIDRYWCLSSPNEKADRKIQEAELVEEFRQRFTEAVQRRMIADVPLGAFLSGGVDSSAVVAAMARVSDAPVKTFSIGFEDETFDETEHARAVARRYGTDHHEDVVRPEALSILPKIVWHHGEPFADPSAIPTFYVSELARRHVTVALSGDGGDELFLGYSRYHSLFAAETSDGSAQGAGIAGRFWGWLGQFMGGRSHAGESRAQRYAPYLVYFSDMDKREAYGEVMRDFQKDSSLERLLSPALDSISHPVAAAGWADANTYLPDDILVKVDVASMAYSLETRAPFLDHEFAEWVMGLPPEIKYRPGEGKYLLKKALEPWLSDDILYRKKMGFGVPIEQWLCNELRELVGDTLVSGPFQERGIVRKGYVETLMEEHCSGIRQHHTRLWALLMLELWFQMWIDGDQVPDLRGDKWN